MIYILLFSSENTKNVLISASYIHLKHKEHAKYTLDLTTVHPRILLSGPAGVQFTIFLAHGGINFMHNRLVLNCRCKHSYANVFAGSEIYQEMLAKALAHYFGAKLLIFDSHLFLGVRYL